MKKFVRTTALLLIAFIAIGAAGCVLPRRWSERPPCAGDSLAIFATVYEYHSGIVVPARTRYYDWSNDFAIADEMQYVEIGWGDRSFYMSGGFPLLTAAKALLLPTSSVLHVVPLEKAPFNGSPAPHMRRMWVCAADYRKLITFVRSFYGMNENGVPEYLGRGLYGKGSGFYTANGMYHAVYNCNHWTADALHRAGLPTPLWCWVSQALLLHLPKVQ